MNNQNLAKATVRVLAICVLLFSPLFLVSAYELNRNSIASKPGKYVIGYLEKENTKYLVGVNFITYGQGGDVVVTQDNFNFTTSYVGGKKDSCSINIIERFGLSSKYYYKKCPSSDQKGKYYIEFNGQKSSSFTETSNDESISKDGKTFSATLWNGSPSKAGAGNTVLMGSKKKMVLPHSIFDASYNEYTSSQRSQDVSKRIDVVYLNGVEIARYEGYNGVYVKGLIAGKGPIYATERYLTSDRVEEQAVYIGKNLIFKGSCYVGNISVSPDNKHYAFRVYACASGNGVYYDGKLLANTEHSVYGQSYDEGAGFGFSDNGNFYFSSSENGKKYFNFRGRKVEMPQDAAWKVEFSGDDFALSFSGANKNLGRYHGLVYNGKKIFNDRGSRILITEVDSVLPKNGGVYYSVKNEFDANYSGPDTRLGFYFNNNRIADDKDYCLISVNGSSCCVIPSKKGDFVRNLVINGKTSAQLGQFDQVVVNNIDCSKYLIKEYSPDSEVGGKITVRYRDNSKKVVASFKEINQGKLGDMLSDDGKYLAVLYYEGKKIVKEVVKVK